MTFENVSFAYQDSSRNLFEGLNLNVAEGELCLVIGPTGSGKSTLLQLANGLAPHFTGGRLAGRVTVAGRDTKSHPPRLLADLVGTVNQTPGLGFVTSNVDDELSYVMEQLGVSPALMRTRVEEVVDLLGLNDLRERPLHELSDGEKQRVAIGSVLTSHPRILILDEPTSALDPAAAEEVLAAIVRLVHDIGITVLMAEHKLERVIQFADSIVLIEKHGDVTHGPPREILGVSPIAPPVVRLAQLADWSPLPLSVRQARSKAADLRTRLDDVHEPSPSREPEIALKAANVSVKYGNRLALASTSFELRRGEITALMGRNGSGKTSLLWALQGSGPRSSGEVEIFDIETWEDNKRSKRNAGVDPKQLDSVKAAKLVALVPQNPADLLYLETVEAECAAADRGLGENSARTLEFLKTLSGGIDPLMHPRDLSEGQRLALALAIQISGEPAVLLLDEPTRGLDYQAKASLSRTLARLASDGISVLLSSHDVEFVARTASRVLVLSNGELIADGSARQVLTSSAMLAPQVARILAPMNLMSVDEVRNQLVEK
ncbi:MAG: ATP-binding cassette domain-containing protein [Cryobacterium sp.]|nr:ATP-binding cassette domain-containing protein [Cryobacterium sp.]